MLLSPNQIYLNINLYYTYINYKKIIIILVNRYGYTNILL